MGEGVVRIMLVEDQVGFRRAIAFLLSREPDLEVVAQAGSLDEARRCAAMVDFDVAILDLGLPDGNGADLIGALRETNPGVVVLVMSATLDGASLARAQEVGANGVLDKLATPEEAVGTIRHLSSGSAGT